SATLQNTSPLGLYSIRFEYAVAGSNDWKNVPLCWNLAAPYSCSWSTTGIADGSYDLRVAATRLFTTTYSSVLTDIIVDNTAPAVTMTDPSTPLSGTVTLGATASDGGSGVSAVAFQYARRGTSTWTTICTPTQAPYS